jgi:hypothetical protein
MKLNGIMKYYQFIKILKKKDLEIKNLKSDNEYLRNFGLLSLTFNVGFVMTGFISLMWGIYLKN